MPHSDASITDSGTRLPDAAAAFAQDARKGLARSGQKELPAKYLYDAIGSALFEVITLLPEYGLTRADVRLLERHAGDVARSIRPALVVELGSGSGEKSVLILRTLAAQRASKTSRTLAYAPVDLSAAALRRCVQNLSDVPDLDIHPIENSYLNGLAHALRLRRDGEPVLVLFLGSSIGNLAPADAGLFCRNVRKHMHPGDMFLLSTDLEKEEDRMLAAYDDAIGVTAAFNLNVLSRMNRELNASFDLALFEHAVRYDRQHRRMEMHLVSKTNQDVSVDGSTIHFRRDETIWTESSYKFRRQDIVRLAEDSGFRIHAQWVDGAWPFAQTLMAADE